MPARSSAHADPDPPQVPGIRIEAPLGRGSMGVVWRGVDEATGRSTAVKVLAAPEGPKWEARFQRELEAIRRLEHPAIVRLLGSGQTAAGAPFCAMELVEGRTLSDALQAGLGLREAAAALATAGRALAHAHARGVVHRDVKPSNIMIDRDGAARLVDFGLSHVAGYPQVTTSAAAVGSPAYLPPEAALGRVADAGAAGDVYALGVVLYEVLCGRTPFAGARTLSELLTRVASETPPPPAAVAVGREVPEALDALCRAAMARVPAERPGARSVADELERWLGAPGATLRPPTTVASPAAPGATDAATARAVDAARALITPEVVRLIRELGRADPPADGPGLPLRVVVAKLLAADLDLDAVLDLTLELLLAATGADSGFVLVADDEGRLTVERGRGLTSADLPPALSTSILAEVARTRAPVVLVDAREDPRFADRESIVSPGLRSVACAPVLDPTTPTRLLGAVHLQDRREAGRFGPEVVTLLADLARLAAGPIRRARRGARARRAPPAPRRARAAPRGPGAAGGRAHPPRAALRARAPRPLGHARRAAGRP